MAVGIEHDVDEHGDCPLGSNLPDNTQCKACPHQLYPAHTFHTFFCMFCDCSNFTCPMCGGGVYL